MQELHQNTVIIGRNSQRKYRPSHGCHRILFIDLQREPCGLGIFSRRRVILFRVIPTTCFLDLLDPFLQLGGVQFGGR